MKSDMLAIIITLALGFFAFVGWLLDIQKSINDVLRVDSQHESEQDGMIDELYRAVCNTPMRGHLNCQSRSTP